MYCNIVKSREVVIVKIQVNISTSKLIRVVSSIGRVSVF
jgi:hypothetical protein